MDNPKYLDLMSKYLSGNIAPAERRELLSWAEESKENQTFFDEMVQVWGMSGEYEEEPFVVDVDTAWNIFEPKLGSDVILESGIAKTDQVVEMPKPGRVIPFYYRRKNWMVAASIAVIAVMGVLFIQQFYQPTNIEVATLDQTEEVLLPDGTKVLLNANSTLQYKRSFKTRNVDLSGEAFFDVASIPDRPFTIYTGNVQTKVVGTAFTVRAYPQEEDIEVTVEEGIVEVAPVEATDEPATTPVQNRLKKRLVPGQSAVYNKKEKVLIETNDLVDVATDWKNRSLGFDDEPLPDAVRRMERYYGIKFDYDPSQYQDCPATMGLEIDPNLDYVLSVLESLMSIEIELDQATGNYTISGKCQ